MSQTTLFLADEHLKKLRCHRRGGCTRRPKWLEKKKQKQKKKGICNLSAKKNIEYMTFATMNYVSLPFY